MRRSQRFTFRKERGSVERGGRAVGRRSGLRDSSPHGGHDSGRSRNPAGSGYGDDRRPRRRWPSTGHEHSAHPPGVHGHGGRIRARGSGGADRRGSPRDRWCRLYPGIAGAATACKRCRDRRHDDDADHRRHGDPHRPASLPGRKRDAEPLNRDPLCLLARVPRLPLPRTGVFEMGTHLPHDSTASQRAARHATTEIMQVALDRPVAHDGRSSTRVTPAENSPHRSRRRASAVAPAVVRR